MAHSVYLQQQKMVFLTTKMMERTALFLSFGSYITSLITAFLPLWKTMNSDLNEVENWFSGLWLTCLYTEERGIQCKAYDSVLGLPVDLQISRVLVLISIGTGGFALLTSFLSLEGVGICVRKPEVKRRLFIFSGVMTWVSGLTTLAPVSIVAYTTVVDFWDEGFPDVMPRWEYGEAMFSGWFGGLGQVIGGTLFFVAVCMRDYDLQRMNVPVSPELKPRTRYYLKTEVL
ncbi:putative claudin-24 [Poecilia latipinna]|uniref:putative claudin-24 n=1 Tax=Poecilia latipinna TaxID=48699 RepID=UPI00072E0818|nr:PREDICTED: putative claudin-24 [Poecilia latipinna]